MGDSFIGGRITDFLVHPKRQTSAVQVSSGWFNHPVKAFARLILCGFGRQVNRVPKSISWRLVKCICSGCQHIFVASCSPLSSSFIFQLHQYLEV